VYEETVHFRTLGLLSVAELRGLMKCVQAQRALSLVKLDWVRCASFGVKLVRRCELKVSVGVAFCAAYKH
jgi:hypothetical protein